MPHTKKVNLDPYLTPYEKINSKWIKGLNLKAKTTAVIEKKQEKNLSDLGFVIDFLNVINTH